MPLNPTIKLISLGAQINSMNLLGITASGDSRSHLTDKQIMEMWLLQESAY